MSKLFESRAKVLEAEARERVLDKEIKLEKLKLINREWVGLTDEEHTQIAIDSGCMSADWVFYGAAVERKVKEKNF